MNSNPRQTLKTTGEWSCPKQQKLAGTAYLPCVFRPDGAPRVGRELR